MLERAELARAVRDCVLALDGEEVARAPLALAPNEPTTVLL